MTVKEKLDDCKANIANMTTALEFIHAGLIGGADAVLAEHLLKAIESCRFAVGDLREAIKRL